MNMRTFVALDINDEVRKLLLTRTLGMRVHPGDIKWVEPELMHVTLNFLDLIDPARMEQVRAIVAEAAQQAAPFDFQVRGLTVAPPKGRARTIWAEVAQADGQLLALQERLTEGFQKLGLPAEERTYRPHVTVARVKFTPATKALRADAEAMAQEDFGTVCAREVLVLTSDLKADGPVYTPVARVPLGR